MLTSATLCAVRGCRQAMRFTMFDAFKSRIVQYNDGEAMTGLQSFLAGGVAGGVSVVVNQPVRV